MLSRPIIYFFLLLINPLWIRGESHSINLLLDWTHNPLHIPLYVGQENGYFSEEGISLTILENVEKSNTLSSLQEGQADIVISYMPNVIRLKNSAVKVIGILVDQPLRALIFREETPLFSLFDLQDKYLGGSVKGLTTQIVCGALARHGIIFKDILPLQHSLLDTLQTNQVDAGVGAFWNIEPIEFSYKGLKTRFFRLSDFLDYSYDELIFVCRSETITQSPALAKSFQRALQKSICFCQEHPQEAFTLYQKIVGLTSEEKEWQTHSWQLTYPLFCRGQRADLLRWKAFYEWIKEQGFISDSCDIESLLIPLIDQSP